MSVSRPFIIDVHSHYLDPAWDAAPTRVGPSAPTWPLLTDVGRQLDILAEAGVDAKVLSAPVGDLVGPGERIDAGLVRAVNDDLAQLVASDPQRLTALGTIDAFQGAIAAREVERVVCRLGFGGVIVDCSCAGEFLNVPAARPAFEAAAALGAPVFIHPVSPPDAPARLARLGSSGLLMARGHESAAGVLALLQSGLLDELPNLRLVIPAVAVSALGFATCADRDHDRQPRRALPSQLRQRLFIDTLGLDAALIGYAVALLGPRQLLFGSGWPTAPLARRDQILETLLAAGVSQPTEQAAILSGNALRLLSRCVDGERVGPPTVGLAALSDMPLQPNGAGAPEPTEAEWDWVVR